MKKFLIASSIAMITLTSCTSKEVEEKQDVNLVTMNVYSQTAEVIAAQLNSAGFDTNVITTPDYSSFVAELNKNEYDIATTGWTTVTGNPDYAVMSLFHSDGDFNNNGLNDKELNLNLEVGRSSETGSENFINAYYEVERILNENAYIVPMTYSLRNYAISKDLDENTIDVYKSRSMKLEDFYYSEESQRDNETDPVIVAHNTINLTSFDPMKANDGTVFALNTNQYARLVNLGPNDNIEPGVAKAYGTEDQNNFYFALRDDAYFSNGEKISPEDIAFSLLRASSKNEEGNRVYSIQGNIASVREVGYEEIPEGALLEMAKTGEFTENDEFIMITTFQKYGQLYNMLTHTSGGIVSKKAVVNSGDKYGTMDNIDNIVASGPYIVTEVNPTTNEIILERNKYYYENVPIKNVIFKVIPEMATAVNALQSGEIDFVYNIPTEQYSVVEKAGNTTLLANESNAFNYIQFNLKNESRASNINFRKAVYNAIDPKVILQLTQLGRGGVGASPLSPVLNSTYPTGYKKPEPNKEEVSKYLQEFKTSTGE